MPLAPELPLLSFIPFRRADIAAMLLADGTLSTEDKEIFLQAKDTIESYFQQDFYQIKQQLKDVYAPLDPDADTRLVAEFRQPPAAVGLSQMLEEVLDRANYEKVTNKGLKKALRSHSLFQVRLHLELDDFEEVLLYTRGASRREETLREFFGLWRRKVKFINYDRVVLYIRLKEDIDSESTLGVCQPGSTMLKLFQNVPAADLEMLFPNIRVGMRLLDKLMIGVPALISGGVVFTTKVGATLILLGSLIGFWIGVKSEPVTLDKASAIALIAGLGTLVGYLWKQFSNFRNRKLKYTQALTENLYFKLLDNNGGVLHRVIDDAEESECKESLLAYYFLLIKGEAVTPSELDELTEAWLAERWQCRMDFEIDDALNKLQTLGLAQFNGERWELTAG
jgi:hypothetical protein